MRPCRWTFSVSSLNCSDANCDRDSLARDVSGNIFLLFNNLEHGFPFQVITIQLRVSLCFCKFNLGSWGSNSEEKVLQFGQSALNRSFRSKTSLSLLQDASVTRDTCANGLFWLPHKVSELLFVVMESLAN